MSGFLWKFYLEDDVDRFRRLLAEAGYVTAARGHRGHHVQAGNVSELASSLGSPGPTWITAHRKSSGQGSISTTTTGKWQENWSTLTLTRADVNLRDRNGLTILHHAASLSTRQAVGFATALIDHPLIDLYLQDEENGWTALHRALYFGNIFIARAILNRDMRDASGYSHTIVALHPGKIIKVKDKEGNSPFDVLRATIADQRAVFTDMNCAATERANDSDEDDYESGGSSKTLQGDWAAGEAEDSVKSATTSPLVDLDGDEVLTFGSNKNFNLGFGDEDDRQYPERVGLKRPDHLLQRFYYEHLQTSKKISNGERSSDGQDEAPLYPSSVSSLPSLIRNKPIVVQDVLISKLHTAILTNDPESNLHMCGYGPGGRLGTGDEITRFTFVCIDGGGLFGKRIVNVGLGQNHTLATTSEGDVFSWGTNTYGQLGYTLPKPNTNDKEPVQSLPRQLFGSLKREIVIGAAASRVHSVLHTATSLFTFGKNDGQLGLVDSDARSLEVQATPRRIGASLFSSSIHMTVAVDRATICLLENREVWVFANFGYAKVSFPLDGFPNYFLKFSKLATRYAKTPNQISKIRAGGETICALSTVGDVYTIQVHKKLESRPSDISTTNPNKIRSGLTYPQRIWSSRKEDMAVQDLSVGQDGSVIICTVSGSVWKRIDRPKGEVTRAAGTSLPKSKDYKFSRVPGLSRVSAVRSNIFGAYAAVRNDYDITKTTNMIGETTFLADIGSLLPFESLCYSKDCDGKNDQPVSSKRNMRAVDMISMKEVVSKSANLETDVHVAVTQKMLSTRSSYDADVYTTKSDVGIPVHQFLLAARSFVFRRALTEMGGKEAFAMSDLFTAKANTNANGRTEIRFQGFDFLSIFQLVTYLYTDEVVPYWHDISRMRKQASRFRQVRLEVMEIASHLQLRELELATRGMRMPNPRLKSDLRCALSRPEFFNHADLVIELAENEVKVHSAVMCQRCPFFEGIMNGRAAGKWLSSRRLEDAQDVNAVRVDLSHFDPDAFQLVLRYLYCDSGQELFDDIVATDLDEFLDLVIEVMSIANELMITRLCQVCQQVIGRFVTTRNACQLLNAVAPCSATIFKYTCLEYICLNLEGLLENHLLDDLDEDLLLELDEVVRANQLAYLPFAKSSRSEMVLLEKFPQLSEARDRERQARIDSAAHAMRGPDREARGSVSLNSKAAQQKPQRRASNEARSAVSSPRVRPKTSTADLIFRMDEDEEVITKDMSGPTRDRPDQRTIGITDADLGRTLSSPVQSHAQSATSLQPEHSPGQTSPTVGSSNHTNRPWGASALSSEKLNMKEIMAQTSTKRGSNLSLGLSAQAKSQTKVNATFAGKVSQRERKKQQQDSQMEAQPTVVVPDMPLSNEKSISPWQNLHSGQKVSLKDVLSSEGSKQERVSSIPIRTVTNAELDRPIGGGVPKARSGQSQERSMPLSMLAQSGKTIKGDDLAGRSSTQAATLAEPSRSYAPSEMKRRMRDQDSHILVAGASRGVEPSLQLSMADIISQQQAEQDVIKQVVAKRPLRDIQQEQEFMEWWYAESRKVMEGGEQEVEGVGGRRAVEQKDIETSDRRQGNGRGRGRSRGRGRGRGVK